MTIPTIYLVPLGYNPEENFAHYQILSGPTFPPGTAIKIVIPVTNNSNVAVTARGICTVKEGSVYPGGGKTLKTITSASSNMTSGQTLNFTFPHTTVQGTIERRDVNLSVEYQVSGSWIQGLSREWDDVYYVTQNAYEFSVGTPSVVQA
jgi:hypothetical protein